MKSTQIIGKPAKKRMEKSTALVCRESSDTPGGGWLKPESADSVTGASDPDLHQMISEAAYFRSEQRGFVPGSELQDWVDAENEIRHKRSLGGCVSSTSH